MDVDDKEDLEPEKKSKKTKSSRDFPPSFSLISQCNLEFTVYISHFGFPKFFPDCSLEMNVLAPLRLFHNLSQTVTHKVSQWLDYKWLAFKIET